MTVVALLAAAALLVVPAATVGQERTTSFAGKIDDHASQRDEVARKIETTDRSIIVLSSQIDRLKRELAANQDEKAKTEREINELNRELATAAATVERLRVDLESARATYDGYHSQFTLRLVHYHRMKSRPLLGVLFNSKDLTDLTRRYRYYTYLSREDTETLARLRSSRDDIQARKEDLERREQAQAGLKRRLERKNAALLTTIQEQDGLSVRIRQEKLHAERRVTKLKQAHGYLTKKIASLQRAQSLLDQSTARPAVEPSGPSVRPGAMLWPLEGDVTVVRPFGYTENVVGTSEFSAGLDIRVTAYATVRAAAAGTVVFRGPFSPTYGNIVMIDHGGTPDNVFSIYGNLDQIFVPQKKVVRAGDPVGSVGARAALEGGETTFHFEIRKRTTPVDPLLWLDTTQRVSHGSDPGSPPGTSRKGS